MRIGVFAKTRRKDFARELMEVLSWLRSKGAEPLVAADLVESFDLVDEQPTARETIPQLADAIVVFGGDGTMLSVARLVGGHSCPILGVNLGTLGFLTEVPLGELYPALERLLAGEYSVDRRCMLKAEVCRGGKRVEVYHALNDVVINKAALARVITVDTFYNDSFIASFVADGVIVSTPTGSTAYSMSAGGPIVYPSLSSILVTPICPHTLTNRPLIIPAAHRMRLLLRSGEDVMVTVDGQVGVPFSPGDEVICTDSPYSIELIRPGERGFFDVLREKLNWAKR